MKSTTTVVSIMVILGMLAVGCGDNFLPPSYLNGLRVLALVADPVEAGPTDEIVISPAVYLPEGETLTSQTWTFCPFSLGPTASFECAVPACETELIPEPDGSVRASPGVLAIQCALELAKGEIPDVVPEEIPEKVDVYFNFQVSSSSGEIRDAALKVALWTQSEPAELNSSPFIESVQVGGQNLSVGESAEAVAEDEQVEVMVKIDPDSLDTYLGDDGDNRTEEAIVSFFASAGRFEFDRLAGEETTIIWEAKKLEPGQTQAEIYVVARDLRGGQAVFGPVFIPLLR